MDAKIGQFFESIGNFFGNGDQIPWCDPDTISVSLSLFFLNVILILGFMLFCFLYSIPLISAHCFLSLRIWPSRIQNLLDDVKL